MEVLILNRGIEKDFMYDEGFDDVFSEIEENVMKRLV